MAKTSQSTTTIGRLIFWAASIALVLSFALFVLEKTRITNLYSKPQVNDSATTEQVSTINKVDYKPATPEAVDEGEIIKQQAAEQGSQTSTSSNIEVSLSAAGQDTKGGPIVVRTVIIGGGGGTCTLTITNNSVSKEYTANVENVGTYNSCQGFNIPVAELSAGSYTVTLSVVNGTSKGTVSQTIEVSK